MKKILSVLFILSSLYTFASHIAGGQITYKCLGNNQYEVKLTYFWDCAGGFNPGASQIINIAGCSQSMNLTVNQSTTTPGDGILAGGLCPTASTVTTCKKRIEYTGIVTLPSACNSWTLSIGSCCRSANIINQSPTQQDYFHQATLNNLAAPCNNSPDISIGDLPNFCVNQPACFNLGATEIDGHTLSYSLVSAYASAGLVNTYIAPYSGAVPIVGITINASTGQVNFTPTTIGDFVINVLITETDGSGNIVGTIMRDFQAIVTNCNNQTVSCGQGNITNVTSGTVPGGSGNTLQICENIPFCFDVNFTDPNGTDSIKISSPNMSTSLPGSSMVLTYTPGITNQVKATICWTPPQGSSGLNTNFVLIVKDNACPVPGTQILNYFIDVLPATSAGPDRTICGSQSASITATGSSTVFAWSDLAGNPITVGPAFSCNPCSNPVIKPSVTTTYVVTNIGGGLNCKNKDTLTINVAPDFTLTAGSAVGNSCLNSAVQFTSTVSPAAGVYSYTWSPSAPLTTTNTANTSATYTAPGAYNYTLTAISSAGCLKQSSNIPFNAQPVVMPIFTVTPTNTVVCGGNNFPLDVNFNAAPPTSCGLATTGCVAPSIITVGNGTAVNGTTGYPAPYANFYDSQHFQMLYTAAELLAAGVVPGKISSLAFNVTALNTLSNQLKDYTIKIKCTSATSATTFDMAGLTQVYSTPFLAVANGWNTHSFASAYEWNGTTNLLIDVCYNDNGFSYTQNAASPYTTTGFTSVVYYRVDGSNACPITTISGTSSNRPNVRIGNCSSVPDPNSFSYSWLPATGLSSTSVKSPTANISASQIYTVVVTPTAAPTCSNVGTTNISITIPAMPTITAVGPVCSNSSSFSLTATPAGGTWSVTAATNASGVFTPSLATIGNNIVYYTYGAIGCVNTTTMNVSVEQFNASTITTSLSPQCSTNPALLLPLTASSTGTWTGTGVSGVNFDPALAGVGTHVLTYSTSSSPTASLCPSSSTISVSVSSITQPTISAAGPYCDNFATQTMTVIPTGGGTGVWSSPSLASSINTTGDFAPAAAIIGNNTVLYTVTNGPCVATASITVQVVHYLDAAFTGTMGPYCIYDPAADLQTIAQNTGGIWSGTGVSGTYFDPAVAGAGVHSITYNTDPAPAGLCPDQESISILVNPTPTVVPLAQVYAGCNYPFMTSFYTPSVNTGILTWNFGDNSSTESGFSPSHVYTSPGTYTVTTSYVDNVGCTASSTVATVIEVYEVPDSGFEPSPDVTTVVDAEVVFTNQTTNLNNNTYIWNFANLGGSTDVSPTYLFTNSGEFFVTLIATSPNNCKDTTIKKVTVNPDVVLYIPNSFTPNGDGLNDELQIFLPPTGVDYSTFSLTIYDRWGSVIYKTNDVTKSWNGARNNSGEVMKQDVYVFKINFQDEKKKLYEKMGHITLMGTSK